MNFSTDSLGERTDELVEEFVTQVREQPLERLIMGEYGGMSNRERALRVYLSLVMAMPFANLVVTSDPTALRSVVALVSFGVSFTVGWRAGYETLHVGDRPDRGEATRRTEVDESYGSDEDSLAEVEERGSS